MSFLEILQVAKEELSCECDYQLEASNQKRFRDLLSSQEGFYVPFVVDDLSSKRVITTELVSGNYVVSFRFLLFLSIDGDSMVPYSLEYSHYNLQLRKR